MKSYLRTLFETLIMAGSLLLVIITLSGQTRDIAIGISIASVIFFVPLSWSAPTIDGASCRVTVTDSLVVMMLKIGKRLAGTFLAAAIPNALVGSALDVDSGAAHACLARSRCSVSCSCSLLDCRTMVSSLTRKSKQRSINKLSCRTGWSSCWRCSHRVAC